MLGELQPHRLAEQESQPLKLHDACATPQSQLSTAPPTPLQSWALPVSMLPDGNRFERMCSAGSSVLALEPLLSSEDEEQAEECDSADEGEGLCVGMPALQSDLGKFAQRVVAAREFMDQRLFADDCSTAAEDEAEEEEEEASDDDTAVEGPPRLVAAGMAKLQSDLGQWARRVVAAEEWLEERLASQFVVDDSDLEVSDVTLGVLYRFSKHASDRDCWSQGPQWGDIISGVDQGDGWVKVRRRYLPIMLNGKQILTPVEA